MAASSQYAVDRQAEGRSIVARVRFILLHGPAVTGLTLAESHIVGRSFTPFVEAE